MFIRLDSLHRLGFSLGHMSMDLSSVFAALFSHGDPLVTGTNIQVASPQGCTPGLARPEPSGTFFLPEQHLQPLNLERGELRLRDRRRYLQKYRRLLKQVEDSSESSEIRHLLQDIQPSRWKKRVEDEEKKRAKKHLAVRIMSPEDQHPRHMECFQRNRDRMISMTNSLYVEVFGDTAGEHLLQLNNVEWRRV